MKCANTADRLIIRSIMTTVAMFDEPALMSLMNELNVRMSGLVSASEIVLLKVKFPRRTPTKSPVVSFTETRIKTIPSMLIDRCFPIASPIA